MSRSTPLPLTDNRPEWICQHTFASLRKVRIECVPSFDYNETLPMMRTPFWERFYTCGLSKTCYNWVTPPDSSVVRQLELHRCEMSYSGYFVPVRPLEGSSRSGTYPLGPKGMTNRMMATSLALSYPRPLEGTVIVIFPAPCLHVRAFTLHQQGHITLHCLPLSFPQL